MPAWKDRVSNWAKDRNILDDSSPLKQFKKLIEEVGELELHLKELEACTESVRAMEIIGKIKDDLGDIPVVCCIIGKMLDLDFEDCLEQAWNDIKDRKGKLINGVFVKESDL
jgi:NTP pyrophosphatase (non-canonical NTP hydrolase)